MYCGCNVNIPFWTWLKENQNFASSIGCYDYDGLYLENLKPCSFDNCYGEHRLQCVLKLLRVSEEVFEDTKWVIRSRKSNNNRQLNGHDKRIKRTNNALQNIHIQLKIE